MLLQINQVSTCLLIICGKTANRPLACQYHTWRTVYDNPEQYLSYVQDLEHTKFQSADVPDAPPIEPVGFEHTGRRGWPHIVIDPTVHMACVDPLN